MRKLLTLILVLPLLLFGCGEAGVESDVSKITEIEFTVSASDFTDLGGFLVADLAQMVDPAGDDFAEYLDDVENYIINELSIQILEYASTNDDPTVIFVGIGVGPVGNTLGPNVILEDTRTGGATPLVDGLANSNGELANSEKLLIYDRRNPASGLIADSNLGLMQIVTALTNSSPFEGRIQVALQGGAIASSFQVKLFLDLTARVQLDD